MEWQAIVLVIQILMLAIGWFLFQQARGELSARAAETPVLGEVKALQRNIKQLLADMEQAADRSSQQLEMKCIDAAHLLHSLNALLDEINLMPTGSLSEAKTGSIASDTAVVADSIYPQHGLVSLAPPSPKPLSSGTCLTSRDLYREAVFARADLGEAPAAIARDIGLSEGEIETLLGLRIKRA